MLWAALATATIVTAPTLLAVSVAVLARSAERRADARRVLRLLRSTKRQPKR
jgi:hypothetical protein